MKLDFEDGYVRVAGHRIYWKAIGEPIRGSVLCLHGGPGVDHWLTLELADLAPSGYRVVMYDQLGCGRSERPRSYRGYTMRTAADEVDAVRRALRLGRCHLYGASFGAALALQAILQRPGGFRSLIVSSGWACQAELESEIARLVRALPERERRAIETNEARGTPEEPAYRAAVASFFRRHISGARLRPFEIALGRAHANPRVERALTGGDGRLLAPTGGAMAGWDIRPLLPRIRVPTLITVGGRDHVTPRCARTLQRGIPNSRLIVFRRSGHNHAFRERELYMATVLEFLETEPSHPTFRKG